MSKHFVLCLATLMVYLLPVRLQAASQIEIFSPGHHWQVQLTDGARLSNLLMLPSLPRSTDWSLAVISTPAQDAVIEQLRQRVSTQLEQLEYLWLTGSENRGGYAVHQLRVELLRYAFAGRLFTNLDPDWVRTKPGADPVLQGKYRLRLRPAASGFRVAGLIDGAIDVEPNANMADVATLLKQRKCLPMGDCRWGYLIQPDGQVEKIGLQAWNSHYREAAPGALLWVGFDESRLPDGFRSLNQDIISLLRNRISN